MEEKVHNEGESSESTLVHGSDKNLPIWKRTTLPAALIIIIILAATIVAVAYLLYWNSEDRKYDLARGGEQTKNQALNVEDSEAADRTSPVDVPATKKKIEYLQSEIRALGSLGNFESGDVSDQNLQLVEPEPTSF